MSTHPQFAAGSISQELHDRNLEIVADIERRELLEAIQYERNYSPLTWFRAVAIAPRENPESDRKICDGKIERLKLLGKHGSWAGERRQLEAEIREIEKQLLEGKQ